MIRRCTFPRLLQAFSLFLCANSNRKLTNPRHQCHSCPKGLHWSQLLAKAIYWTKTFPPRLTSVYAEKLESAAFFFFFFFLVQVLAGGLSSHRGGRDLRQPAVPGAHERAVHGQVRYFCQDERGARGTLTLLLHDGRQDGQNAGAARELQRSGSQSRHRGQQGGSWRSGDGVSVTVTLS